MMSRLTRWISANIWEFCFASTWSMLRQRETSLIRVSTLTDMSDPTLFSLSGTCMQELFCAWEQPTSASEWCAKSNKGGKKGKNSLQLFSLAHLLRLLFFIVSFIHIRKLRRCRSHIFSFCCCVLSCENERKTLDSENNPKVRLECVSKSMFVEKMKSFIFCSPHRKKKSFLLWLLKGIELLFFILDRAVERATDVDIRLKLTGIKNFRTVFLPLLVRCRCPSDFSWGKTNFQLEAIHEKCNSLTFEWKTRVFKQFVIGSGNVNFHAYSKFFDLSTPLSSAYLSTSTSSATRYGRVWRGFELFEHWRAFCALNWFINACQTL